MDREQRVAEVVWAAEHGLELERRDVPLDRGDLPVQLVRHPGIRLGSEELGEPPGVRQAADQVIRRRDPRLERLDLLDQLAGPLLIRPERWVGLLLFELP